MRVYNSPSEHSLLEQFEIGETFQVSRFQQFQANITEAFRQTSQVAAIDIARLSPTVDVDTERLRDALAKQGGLDPATVARIGQQIEEAPRDEPLTEQELKESEHFREGMDFQANLTADQWEIMAERFDQKQITDFERDRGDSMLATVVGNIVGGIPDMMNFIPFLGSYRAARLTARVAKASGEAGIGAVATEPLLFLQADVTREEHDLRMAAANVAAALAIGGSFGALGHGLSRISAKQRGWAVHKAAQDMIDGKKTDVGPILGVDESPDAPVSGAKVAEPIVEDVPEAAPIPPREAGQTEVLDPDQLSLLDKELAELDAENLPGGRLDDADKEFIAQGDVNAKAKLDEADAIVAAAACLTG